MKKKIYCFLPLFFLTFVSCAKTNLFLDPLEKRKSEDPSVVNDLWTKNYAFVDSKLICATTQTYNNNGLVSSSLQTNVNTTGDEWEKVLKITNTAVTYEYNSDNLLISKITKISDDSKIVRETCELHDYDDHKNETKYVIMNTQFDHIKFNITVNNYSYKYDNRGNIIEKVTSCFNNYIPSSKKCCYYTYDEKNRLINASSYYWSDYEYFDDPSYASIKTIRYDYGDKKMTKTTYTKGVGLTDISKSILISELNDKGNPIAEMSYYYDFAESKELKQIDKYNYEYDQYGQQTSMLVRTALMPFTVWGELIKTTSYCGRNHDKIESSMHIQSTPGKNGQENDRSLYEAIHNYYDDKERIIKKEIVTGGNGLEPKPGRTQTNVYLFEY